MQRHLRTVVAFLLIAVLFALLLPLYQRTHPQTVFVKTFDAPEGKRAPVVKDDDTPVVEYWWHSADRHLVYHQSGNLTYVDTPTFRRIAAGE